MRNDFEQIGHPTARALRTMANMVRLQHLARRLHELGPDPLFYLLQELEEGADLRDRLERYAALPAYFIKANGGDRLDIVREVK